MRDVRPGDGDGLVLVHQHVVDGPVGRDGSLGHVLPGGHGRFTTDASGIVTIGCFYGGGTFTAAPGQTYIIRIGDVSGGPGGELHVTFAEPPPPPTVHVTLDRFAAFDPRTGVATLRGTITCTDATLVEGYADLKQVVGRLFTIQASGGVNVASPPPCDGQPHPWSADMTPSSGRFGGGAAQASVVVYVWGRSGAAFDSASGQVTLRH